MILSLELTPAPFHSTAAIKAEEWDRLLPQIYLNTPFATWEWHNLWWKHFGHEGECSLLIAREQERIIGIVPLYHETSSGHLKFIGGEDLSDFLDILVVKEKEAQVWRQVLEYLEISPIQGRGLDLHSLPANSPTVQVLPLLAEERGYQVKVEMEEVSPVLSLPKSWEAYLALLNAKDRHELRRKMRRAEEASPPLRFRQCAEDECARHDILSFISLHKKSRPEKEAFMDEEREAFFRDVSQTFARKGWLRLYILERDQEAVAAVLCFDYGESLYLYNSGFDPELSSLSPGIVLIGYSIQDAISRGKRWFDFMRGNEDYKHRLGGKDTPIYRILIERP
jgi:CelD/BcsL family acetyltransferase involved in cellulose biosynthesis